MESWNSIFIENVSDGQCNFLLRIGVDVHVKFEIVILLCDKVKFSVSSLDWKCLWNSYNFIVTSRIIKVYAGCCSITFALTNALSVVTCAKRFWTFFGKNCSCVWKRYRTCSGIVGHNIEIEIFPLQMSQYSAAYVTILATAVAAHRKSHDTCAWNGAIQLPALLPLMLFSCYPHGATGTCFVLRWKNEHRGKVCTKAGFIG